MLCVMHDQRVGFDTRACHGSKGHHSSNAEQACGTGHTMHASPLLGIQGGGAWGRPAIGVRRRQALSGREHCGGGGSCWGCRETGAESSSGRAGEGQLELAGTNMVFNLQQKESVYRRVCMEPRNVQKREREHQSATIRPAPPQKKGLSVVYS